MVFAYRRFYPDGGIKDLVGCVDSLDEVIDCLDNADPGSELLDGNVYDTKLEKIDSKLVYEYTPTPEDKKRFTWRVIKYE